jgi:hypothetical protein
VGRFVGRDIRFVFESRRDVVESCQEALSAEGVDRKGQRQTMLVAECRGFKVDGELVAGMLPDAGKQIVNLGGVEANRQNAVLEAVVVEDIGEARRDQGAKTIVLQGPRGVFAARSTAEVSAYQEDRRAFGLRPVELEIGILRTVLADRRFPRNCCSSDGESGEIAS